MYLFEKNISTVNVWNGEQAPMNPDEKKSEGIVKNWLISVNNFKNEQDISIHLI